MIEYLILILVWIGIILIVSTYILYPLIIWIWSKLVISNIKFDETATPDVTILVSAYNEEDNIPDLIESIYNSNYPKEKIKVIIGSDGSIDDTVRVAKEIIINYPNVNIIELPHSGKNSTINTLVQLAETDIIILMDADLRVQLDTLKHLVKYSIDDSIAIVQSNIMYMNNDSTSNAGTIGESRYQQYENFLRKCESRISSTVNNFGIYLLRRKFFSIIPNDRVCDDMYQIYQAILKGKRVIVSEEAISIDARAKNTVNELNRRIRLAAGGMATIASSRQLMNPFLGSPAFFLWFHKIFRWFSPIFMIIFFAALFVIESFSTLWYVLLVSQLLLFVFAFLGWLGEKFGFNFVIGRVPLFIILMNWGFLWAMIRFFSGNQNSSWTREGLQKNL